MSKPFLGLFVLLLGLAACSSKSPLVPNDTHDTPDSALEQVSTDRQGEPKADALIETADGPGPDTTDDLDAHPSPDACVPECEGRECGPDGCFGSCGQCDGLGEQCQAGQCVCVPDCTEKTCGGDGCGGSCGSCQPGWDCKLGNCACNGKKPQVVESWKIPLGVDEFGGVVESWPGKGYACARELHWKQSPAGFRVTRVSEKGEWLWEELQLIQEAEYAQVFAVARCPDDSLVVGGNWIAPDTVHHGLMQKYDVVGNLEWVVPSDQIVPDRVLAVTCLDDGTVVIAGEGVLPGPHGPKYQVISPAGEVLSTTSPTSFSSGSIRNVLLLGEGRMLLGVVAKDWQLGGPTGMPYQLALVEVDSIGETLWEQVYPTERAMALHRLAHLAVGSYALVSSAITVDETKPIGYGDVDFHFLLVGQDGSAITEASYGYTMWDRPGALLELADGHLLMGGSTADWLDSPRTPLLFEIDGLGVAKWFWDVEGYEDAEIMHLRHDSNGDVVAVGIERHPQEPEKPDELFFLRLGPPCDP